MAPWGRCYSVAPKRAIIQLSPGLAPTVCWHRLALFDFHDAETGRFDHEFLHVVVFTPGVVDKSISQLLVAGPAGPGLRISDGSARR